MNEGAEPGLGITCQEVVELVTDYLEGALDEGAAREVAAHLAGCPGCVRYVEQVRATASALGRLPVPELAPSACAELLAAFHAQRR